LILLLTKEHSMRRIKLFSKEYINFAIMKHVSSLNQCQNYCFRKPPRKPRFNFAPATETSNFLRGAELNIADRSHENRREITSHDEDRFDSTPVQTMHSLASTWREGQRQNPIAESAIATKNAARPRRRRTRHLQ